MSRVTHLAQRLEDLYQQLKQVQTEVASLQEVDEAESVSPRSLRTVPAAPPRPALPNVILPTPTDDPDSIVGGKRTLYKDFQDCCAVGNEQGYFCSGTLIAPTIVVTAKHCEGVTRVFLKGNDISWPEEGETIPVSKTHPHPDGNVDLQLLMLAKPASVSPRRIAQIDKAIIIEEVMLVGFGNINLSGTFGYGIKRQVKVPLTYIDTQNDEDYQMYGCRGDFELVAGHRGLGKDSCKGDSGGPLYIQEADGSYALLGATSRGAKNAENVCGDGGIYVRVDKFLDWIEKVSKEGSNVK